MPPDPLLPAIGVSPARNPAPTGLPAPSADRTEFDPGPSPKAPKAVADGTAADGFGDGFEEALNAIRAASEAVMGAESGETPAMAAIKADLNPESAHQRIGLNIGDEAGSASSNLVALRRPLATMEPNGGAPTPAGEGITAKAGGPKDAVVPTLPAAAEGETDTVPLRRPEAIQAGADAIEVPRVERQPLRPDAADEAWKTHRRAGAAVPALAPNATLTADAKLETPTIPATALSLDRSMQNPALAGETAALDLPLRDRSMPKTPTLPTKTPALVMRDAPPAPTASVGSALGATDAATLSADGLEIRGDLLLETGRPQTLQGASVGTSPAVPSPVAPQPAPVIARIVAEAEGAQSDSVEISLDPPELGKVRINFSNLDGQMTAMLSAERPEIEALIRRHAEALRAAFAEAGLTDVALDFGSFSGQGSGPHSEPDLQIATPPDFFGITQPDDAAATQALPTAVAGGGLDIRL